MKEIISQCFSFAVLKVFRPYSHISENPHVMSEGGELSYIDDNFFGSFIISDVKRDYITLPTPNDGKVLNSRTTYHTTDSKESNVSLKMVLGPITTQNDEKIKKYYGNPFVDVTTYTIERRVTVDGPKIKIVLDVYKKNRKVNHKFFRKTMTKSVLIINTDKGNFTVGTINKMGKRRSTKFTTNSIDRLIVNGCDMFKVPTHSMFWDTEKSPTNHTFKSYLETFNDEEFYCGINSELLKKDLRLDDERLKLDFINEVSLMYSPKDFESSLWLDTRIMIILNFMFKKEIKCSDKPYKYLIRYYPTEKFLKKNDRKLMVSIADSMGLNYPIIVKLLHQWPDLDIINLSSQLKRVMGDGFIKYMNSLDFEKINKERVSLSLQVGQSSKHNHTYVGDTQLVTPTKTESSNIIKIINKSITDERLSNTNTGPIFDHMKMITEILSWTGVRYYLNSNSLRGFLTEHSVLSKTYRRVRRNSEIVRRYNEDILDVIEKPYINNVGEYQIRILKTQTEFEDEGEIMDHCVAGYANRSHSLIISVIESSSTDRVTLEYVKHDLIQSKSHRNQPPPERFEEVIDEITKRVSKIKNRYLEAEIDIFMKKNGVTLSEKYSRELDELNINLPF